jgi:hypothetical protein
MSNIQKNNPASIGNFNSIRLYELINSYGYENPSIDKGDARQRAVWNILQGKNVDIVLQTLDSAFISKIATNHDKYHRYFQCRMHSEDPTRVNDLYEEFFVDKIALRRLPIVFEIEDKMYTAIGNHRLRAFEKGFRENPASKVTGHVLIVDPRGDLTLKERVRLGKTLADISNRETGNETQPETYEDIANQIKNELALLEEIDPKSYDEMEEHDMREYINNWLQHMKGNTSERTCARARNLVFAEHISQSIALPNVADLNTAWQVFWPRSTWSPATSKINQKVVMTHYNNFKNTMFNSWYNREKQTDKNKRLHLCARVGSTMSANITSCTTIKKDRKSFIVSLTEWNTNANILEAGYPIITKVMFVKQTQNTHYKAFEWDEENEEFFEN